MAIKIPSKHIYEKQNPKIRDNIIERVEVGAVEITPNNEYETTVYNETITSGWGAYKGELSNIAQAQKNINSAGTSDYWWYRAVGYLSVNPRYLEVYITIPKLNKNTRKTKIYHSYKKDEVTGENVADIKAALYADKITGSATAQGHYDFVQDSNGAYPSIKNIKTTYNATENFNGNLSPKLSYTHETANLTVTNTIDYIIEETIANPYIYDDENNFYLRFKCLVGYEQVFLSGEKSGYSSTDGYGSEGDVSLSGTCEKYIPKKLEITIYGDTIGIDIADKIIYIPENNKTSKKVYSIDGNELVQTNNYSIMVDEPPESVDFESSGWTFSVEKMPIEDGNGNEIEAVFKFYFFRASNLETSGVLLAKVQYTDIHGTTKEEIGRIAFSQNETYKKIQIEVIEKTTNPKASALCTIYKTGNFVNYLYKNIREKYQNGKETATIRCSISDYYDYSTNNRVIAIDNSTSKMSFDLYDQVIPMVYGANGQDKPMSLNQDGTPKIFNVLGVKTFYDGAVWQELSLQEV